MKFAYRAAVAAVLVVAGSGGYGGRAAAQTTQPTPEPTPEPTTQPTTQPLIVPVTVDEPEPAPPPAPVAGDSGTSITYDHRGQLSLYAHAGVGYRVIFRYDEDDFCGTAAKSVCTSLSPPFLELGVGYAFTSHVEMMVDVRLGLVGDFRPETSSAAKPHVLAFQPGIRFYIDDEGSVKWFTGFAVSIDRTDYSASGVATSTDVGIRNVNGLLIDLHRTFGVYVHFGETLSFVRWMRFEIDGGLGMQARFP
jgi:hypothetical protein